MQHILVVDDDDDLTTLLTQYLNQFGFATHAAPDVASMWSLLAEHPIGLVVLDLLLPEVDGLELIRELRARSQTPLIVLSTRGAGPDRRRGLEMGADDYMTKPFEPRELVARIQTVMRGMDFGDRHQVVAEAEVIHFDGWTLRRTERQLLTPQGVLVPLSPPEFQLLCTFLATPRRIFSRDQLMEQARGRAMDAFERGIDLLVSRLRQKLCADPRQPGFIKTVRGVGYLFTARSVQGQLKWAP